MAHFFLPGIIGSTSPPLAILDPMISDPASPNPRANKKPIFTIAFSIITVSYYSPSSPSPLSLTNFCSLAEIGFLAIAFTFSIILSIGPRAN